jgi:hypothetical protein
VRIVAESACSSRFESAGWPTLTITTPPGASRTRQRAKNSRVVR